MSETILSVIVPTEEEVDFLAEFLVKRGLRVHIIPFSSNAIDIVKAPVALFSQSPTGIKLSRSGQVTHRDLLAKCFNDFGNLIRTS